MLLKKAIAGYRIMQKIGAGAASELFAVQDRRTKQVWTLKHVLRKSPKDDRFLEQVQQEYQVGSKLHHPNVRAVHRLIKHRKLFKVDAISLLLELVDGTPLDQRLPRTDTDAVRIFLQVARGLAHMHGRGYVHADIKPSNILVTEDDQVKIIDLGQGCPIGTVKKRIQGTPGYMAPEQAHRQTITERTDIYNFGAMMYWVLVREVVPTALPPKDEVNSLYSGALDAAMVDQAIPPHVKNPRIHPLLSKQIMDCVQLDPDDRPESMEFVANRLELISDLLQHPANGGSPKTAADGQASR
ncbi:MAG: serine/threonine protein kinase [Phycisphaerales bacterium]|nr:serine/threonine protein kinase [Phycisphaerales bacterium]MCI0630222.1 serine/threonine protein kinase [Phycisphaerales bacterium]